MSHLLIIQKWASRTPTVHGGKESVFHLLIIQKVAFQDSHCAWGQRQRFSPSPNTECGPPGLPLCMGIQIQISPSHIQKWASRTPTVYEGKKMLFYTLIIQKVGFQDSHWVRAWKNRHVSPLIYRSGLPGLPLCMRVKKNAFLHSHYTEMGFQDSHCVWD